MAGRARRRPGGQAEPGEDVSGNCDEAEHANDVACGGTGVTPVEPGDDNGGELEPGDDHGGRERSRRQQRAQLEQWAEREQRLGLRVERTLRLERPGFVGIRIDDGGSDDSSGHGGGDD